MALQMILSGEEFSLITLRFFSLGIIAPINTTEESTSSLVYLVDVPSEMSLSTKPE